LSCVLTLVSAPFTNSGLRLAEFTGLPDDVLVRAREISKDLKRKTDDAKKRSQNSKETNRKAASAEFGGFEAE